MSYQHAAVPVKPCCCAERQPRHSGESADSLQRRAGDHKPFLDGEGLAHWPMLFVYPEAHQTDEVQDVCETDTLAEHLDVMFPADAQEIPWDPSGAYHRGSIELWYLSRAATPLAVSQLTEVWAHSVSYLALSAALCAKQPKLDQPLALPLHEKAAETHSSHRSGDLELFANV